jgi:hypothetical protein
LADFETLLDGVENNSLLHIVIASRIAKALAVMSTTIGAFAFPNMGPRGGEIAGIPVHISDHAGTNILLVDARGLVCASEAIILKTSGEAVIEMDDAPTMATAAGSPLAPVGASQLIRTYLKTRLTTGRSWPKGTVVVPS